MRVDPLTKEVTLSENEYNELTANEKTTAWLLKDELGTPCLFGSKPVQNYDGFWSTTSGGIIFLPRELFKDFEQNALVEVELLIRKV